MQPAALHNILLNEVKSTARGAAILAEWLGAGASPVDYRDAYNRAMVCAACPQNNPGHWWEKVKSVLAERIRDYIGVRRALDLETPYDARLGTCAVCKCNNPLQVWVPIEHVRGHTPAAMIEEFPDFCWKKIGLLKPR